MIARRKSEMAVRNELLVKFVCDNIACPIQIMYEMGVNPVLGLSRCRRASAQVAQRIKLGLFMCRRLESTA